MKKTKSFSMLVFCGAALISVSAFAQSSWQNVYFRIDAGYSWLQPPHLKDDPPPVGVPCIICAADAVTPVEISNVHNTWLIGLGIGYRFNENFRSDITYSYRGGAEIMDHDGAGTAISTKIKSNAVFLNGYFDFPSKWQKVKPYVGAGIGWANNQLSDTSYVNAFGASTLLGGTVNNFAWNAGLGLGFEVSKGTIIDIGYRYVDLGRIRLDSQTVQTVVVTGPGYSASGQLRANELQIGFRF